MVCVVLCVVWGVCVCGKTDYTAKPKVFRVKVLSVAIFDLIPNREARHIILNTHVKRVFRVVKLTDIYYFILTNIKYKGTLEPTFMGVAYELS